MAKLPEVANVEGNNETATGFSTLPAGDYQAHIAKSFVKPTKAGTGHYIEMHIIIISGQYKGRMLFERLNIDNPNPIAVNIAKKTINTICAACGLEGVEDSEELHFIPFTVTVKVKPATGEYQESNEIKGYAPADEGEALPWEDKPEKSEVPF